MKRVHREIGDPVWLYVGDHKGRYTKGKVVGVFPWYGEEQYIIEIETGVDPMLEIRGPLAVSDHPEQKIGFWRRQPR